MLWVCRMTDRWRRKRKVLKRILIWLVYATAVTLAEAAIVWFSVSEMACKAWW